MRHFKDFESFCEALESAVAAGFKYRDCFMSNTRYPRALIPGMTERIYLHASGHPGESLAYTGSPVPVEQAIRRLEARGARFNDTPGRDMRGKARSRHRRNGATSNAAFPRLSAGRKPW